MSIGTVLKKYRKHEGCTAKEFSSKMEIPYSTYSNYENDNRKPSYEMLKKFCDFFDVSIDSFLGEVHFSINLQEDREKLTGLDIEAFSVESEIPLTRYLLLEEGIEAPTSEEIKKILNVHLSYLKQKEVSDFDQLTSLRQIIEYNNTDLPKRTTLLDYFDQLNAKGQEKAIESVELLTKVEEYKK